MLEVLFSRTFCNLTVSNNANPVIYLREIQHSEMEAIMQFIYLGKAMFYETRISEFLKVSKYLEIKDLSTQLL